MSESIKKHFSDPAAREKMSKTLMGHQVSQETRKKISAAAKGKPKPPRTEEHRRNMSKALGGRPFCPRGRGENSTGWKGGRLVKDDGYIRIYKPDHPNSVKSYVLEHRLVMESKLGRYLTSGESVHHRNGIKDDNRPENLELIVGPHYGTVVCPFCNKGFLIR
jgi:hypothetical protein